MPPLPRALRVGFAVSGTALAINLVAAVLLDLELGDPALLTLARDVTMWLLALPIAIALLVMGAWRHAAGICHVAAVLLCWLGDGLGSLTGETIVLLGLFLLAAVAFLAALWPSRRRSLAWGWAAIGYGIVGAISGGVIAIGAGPLAVPVLLYALLIAAVAAFAAIDTAGLLGGLLLLAGVLVLGIGLFLVEIPDALRAFAVLVLYVLGQSLLAVSLQQRLGLARALPARA
ncbi:lysoplasmalogenase family protein [Agrococcus sp. Marseille-Q4369]|uniref:lysoplasmalogenase family protein n=1 Tax=Agrococcus sp. Marseille-Q4369 TaxID=2810513 RepID=UPI001B8AD049|nr:lysoplasmalogenase family protein [Agrococcus sp. Marseille-Q4369]QUW19314.1 hypothetical protein JSQ78_02950 [Agrococcus sp. Marseille-Q4369]